MIKIFSLLKGAIVVIFVSFGKVQTAIFFDKINFENFLLIKVYIQNIKNWERASDIQELLNTLFYIYKMEFYKNVSAREVLSPAQQDPKYQLHHFQVSRNV